jgi:adenosylcobinamide-phosphate synthase
VDPFEWQLPLALTLDLLLGDPRWFPHPVRIMGWFCVRLESLFRSLFEGEQLAGVATVSAVLLTTLSLTSLLLLAAGWISPLLADGLAIFLLYTSVAARDLIGHGRAVFVALQTGGEAGLEAGRRAVAMIVGRDTATLDRAGVIGATVESVAENMVDGICAPLFFAVIGAMAASFSGSSPVAGAALAALGYKAVNTMDSMFGHKNSRYRSFGWAAARLDDGCNFIPARLSGPFLTAAAFVLGLDWKNSLRIFLRDRRCHASPNSGHSEAAVAGALGVQLGGDASYFGRPVAKPTMGEAHRALVDTDILATNRLILAASLLFVLFLLLCRRLCG